MTRREEIVQELIQRLTTLGVAPTRGLVGTQINQFPALYLFEDTEDVISPKPGVYRRTLPVWIEYFVEVGGTDVVYELGNSLLEEVQQAVELDERFGELCVFYAMGQNTIYPMTETILELQVRYDFDYLTNFYGYEARRH